MSTFPVLFFFFSFKGKNPGVWEGHEAHDGEDDKSCEHAGARIDAADNDGVPTRGKGAVREGRAGRKVS